MSMSFRAWIIASLFLSLQTLNAQSSTADELKRADKQFDLYAYNLAQKSYQTVVNAEPTNAHALARLADCYMQLNKPEESLRWYDRATSHEDVKNEVLLNYGKALMATGNYTGAKKWFLFYAQHDQETGKHFESMCDYALANTIKNALYVAKPTLINSASSDFSPTFWGEKIIFNSSRSDLSKTAKGQGSNWTGTAYNQIFVTQTDEKGNLQKPNFLKSDLSNTYNEGPIAYSGDGKRVAFCKNNFVDGTRQVAATGINMSLYVADVSNGEWFNIKAFPYNGSDYATGFPCLSHDGSIMYFASNRPEGNGGWDIYQTNWTGKFWSTPLNAGNAVNSKGNEITPYFDGKNLYFASDWHYGFGGLDVFKAEAEKDDWKKIMHLGPGINTSYDDYGFIFNPSKNIGYITSNRPEGKGNEDIWMIQKKTDDFVITVTDANQKPIVGANIDFTACNGNKFTTDADGKYAFSVTSGKANCDAKVSKKGYRESSIAVKSNGNKNITIALESDLVARFIGKVQDFGSKSGLEDALIRALPMPKGDVITVSTAKDGTYILPLEAKKTYKLQYSKEGYNETFMTLETGEAKIQNDISPVLLQNSKATKSENAKKPEVSAISEAPVEHSVETKIEPEKTPTKALEIDSVKTINGFSIQIAALPSKPDATALSKYDALKSLGNIYTVDSGKITKVRIGIFETREAAEKANKKATVLKFKSTFVVEEKGADAKLSLKKPPTTKPIELDTKTVDKVNKPEQKTGKLADTKPSKVSEKAIDKVVDKTEKEEVAPVKPTKTTEKKEKIAEIETKPELKPTPTEETLKKNSFKGKIRFAVQVASLKNDETVNLAPYMKITEYGNVYTRPENDVTKIRVGVWETHEEADEAKDAIVAKGFRDAVIVTEKAIEATERFLIKDKVTASTTTPKGEKTTTAKGEPSKKPAEYKKDEEVKPSTPSKYKVRIATYEVAKNFNTAALEGLNGTLEQQKLGKLTIFLMSGYADLEAAKKGRNDLQSKGFKDAHVVKDNHGKLMRVK
jgi:cell division septation protein DedD/tetratricopeptide (TPR) repeat protein